MGRKIGKQNVYLEHLKGILSLVEKHGKSMDFGRMFFLKNPKVLLNYQPLLHPLFGAMRQIILLISKLHVFLHAD